MLRLEPLGHPSYIMMPRDQNGFPPMPRSRINENFIDKTFSIVANILLRIIPTTSGEKKAFTYYRDGAI
ncbi:hypothetical protein VNO78_37897 [Psophocarpus tetragonolobus]|uniref:Uncharacterized protein n=1 Tax=Psophocarpus tetragonolobus TaxID=3891 RepID=A0AAN9NC27_PSOTE